METTKTHTTASMADILSRVFANGTEVMTPELARHVLGLTFSEADKARMHELAQKNQEGALSAEEHEELDGYVHVGLLLDVLRSKARRSLKRGGAGRR